MKHGGADEPLNMACFEALRLLDVFTRAGAKTFDLTLTALNGEKVSFRRQLTFDRFRQMMPALLERSALQQRNVIVRPQCPNSGPVLIQLDDLTDNALDRVKPAAFLGLLTSPGNYQAWVAVSNPGDADFARRLRKGAGGDPTASGATRIAGSQNFKEKYSPDFPYVQDRAYYARPDHHPGAAHRAGTGRAGRKTPRQAVSSFSHTPRQQEMAELSALRRGRATEPR